MAALPFLFALLVTPPVSAGLPAPEVVDVPRHFGNDPIPTLDKGYLIFHEGYDGLSVYGPDGRWLYHSRVKGPEGSTSVSLGSAAIGKDGSTVIGLGHDGAPGGRGGAIAFLDPRGNHTRTVQTGRYMPSHICVAEDDSIWTLGWQRDRTDNRRADREDYFLVRRYSADGRETGAFLPRRLFPPGLQPGAAGRGLWRIRAAAGRIGLITFSGQAADSAEWMELDLNGNLTGRWEIGRQPGGGLAYTANGVLFCVLAEGGPKGRRLLVFDRQSGTWKAAQGIFDEDGFPEAYGLLLGADGDNLIFAERGGPIRLRRVRAGE